jgi:transposase-like protein
MSFYKKTLLSLGYCSIWYLLFFIFPTSLFAQQNPPINAMIKVSPVILKINLMPGTSQIHTIRVENLTDAPMPIRLAVEGFDASDENGGFKPPSGDSQTSPLAQWITLNNSETIIPAHKIEEILVRIAIPHIVPLGGYYAIIYITPIFPDLSVGSKIGVIALANIGVQGDLHNKAEIVQFDFRSAVYEKNPVTFTARVQNNSLNYFTAKPSLTITSLMGDPQTILLDEKVILPGKIRRWERVFAIQNTNRGIYRATLTVSLENGDHIQTTRTIVLFPIRIALGYMILILSIVFCIVKRKNVRRALLVLFWDKNLPSQPGTLTPPATPVHLPEHQTRIQPKDIIETINTLGAVSETARKLGVHRSTVHRWLKRAEKIQGIYTASHLERKSTRPHAVRTTVLTPDDVKRILDAHSQHPQTAQKLVRELNLSVSARTVHRLLKQQKLVRPYKQSR